jgi:hypothetical protein
LRLEERVRANFAEKKLAASRCGFRRSRAQEERDQEPLDDLLLFESVLRPSDVVERSLGGIGA